MPGAQRGLFCSLSSGGLGALRPLVLALAPPPLLLLGQDLDRLPAASSSSSFAFLLLLRPSAVRQCPGVAAGQGGRVEGEAEPVERGVDERVDGGGGGGGARGGRGRRRGGDGQQRRLGVGGGELGDELVVGVFDVGGVQWGSEEPSLRGGGLGEGEALFFF